MTTAFREVERVCAWCGKPHANVQLPNGSWVHDACAPTFHQKLGETFRRARRGTVIRDLTRGVVRLGKWLGTAAMPTATVLGFVVVFISLGGAVVGLARCGTKRWGTELWQPASGEITQKLYEPAWIEHWTTCNTIFVGKVPVTTCTPHSRLHDERFILVIEGCFANVCKTHAWEVPREEYEHAELHAPWPKGATS